MGKSRIVVSQTRAHIGDAMLTLFRVDGNEPQEGGDGDGSRLLHTHVYHECHLLIRGETTFFIDGSEIPMSAGQMLIIPPLKGHLPFREGDADRGGAEEIVFCLTLENTLGESGFFAYFQTTLMYAACVPIGLSDELTQRFIRFQGGFDGQDLRARCMQMTEVYPLIYALFDAINGYALPGKVKTEVGGRATAVTLDYMVNDPSCTLSDIARTLGYSYRHTARLIRETYHDSLHSIRRSYMLSSAKTLLRENPTMTLEQVAIQSGFSCVNTLIRTFRDAEQMTPTEYRQIWTTNQDE